MSSNVKVMQPAGILDGIYGSQLRQEVETIIEAGTMHILVDCTDISFMDSSGLGMLVMMMRSTKKVNGRFAICSINDQVKILLELTSMDRVLTILPNQEAFFANLLLAS
jgi:anti-sigma B factor antagonist